jgi:hypothetical protein
MAMVARPPKSDRCRCAVAGRGLASAEITLEQKTGARRHVRASGGGIRRPHIAYN